LRSKNGGEKWNGKWQKEKANEFPFSR
jgi:hypothetical protein